MKIILGLLYGLWVVGLFMSKPPQGVVATVLMLAGAAAIFVAGYFFHLFLIRATLRALSKSSG